MYYTQQEISELKEFPGFKHLGGFFRVGTYRRYYWTLYRSRFEEVEVPKLIIVYGSEDMVCNLASVMELYKHATSKDKTLKIYPGM
uniref:Serine aminopeptidase S33 domain-containing protein n=1 Tax=Quercus lobata TaxID=97700 RepID=A0A7N2L4K3_QUELO